VKETNDNNMTFSSTQLMEIAIQAARAAASVVMAGFRQPMVIATKRNFHDLVTEFDKASEEVIRQTLLELLPASRIVGEESGASGEGDVVWYVDPIDGTANFARGLDFWCISIAAAVGGKIIAGAIYAPVSQLMFHADETGAYLNGAPIRSHGARQAVDATLSAHYPLPSDLAHETQTVLSEYHQLLHHYAAVRNMGCRALSLAYVAAGWVDAAFCFAAEPWDVAAGSFLVKQAGGVYRTYQAGAACPQQGDFLRQHFYASVAQAQFPDIEAIMLRHSRLLDA